MKYQSKTNDWRTIMFKENDFITGFRWALLISIPLWLLFFGWLKWLAS
ncbi:hypothetical protein SAMN05421743_10857 [Thalassobacillus cyri]|uniref:Uncharacterized protein n=1 Tax=Thalassobacillus cyri TaxID=571932 RepID=A0A1H4DYS1_9BACI|nr:hypothetical protein [Thalassobacillus cyri]SEA77776.1 hypothetical protein SAMN05421743_10857 [Thalassobacillus cyri]